MRIRAKVIMWGHYCRTSIIHGISELAKSFEVFWGRRAKVDNVSKTIA